MRPTIEEIKAGFAKCGLKPVQDETVCDGGCCGLAAYAAHLGLYLDNDVLNEMEDRLGEEFIWGFVAGWDDGEIRDLGDEFREGYELGREAWEACKCVS